MKRDKSKARRRVYRPLSLDELARIAGLTPRQKVAMRRYMQKKLEN